MRVAPKGVTARVRGAFEETRIAYGATGAVTPAGAVDISPALSQAQMISFPETLKATAFDLFMVVKQAAKLQLDLLEDLDGKPGRVSVLPKPVIVELSAPVGTTQDKKSAGELRWVSVVLPAEFQFQKDQHYWLVLQSLEGQAAWNATPALAGAAGMQYTKDSGLSWRDTIAAGISGPANVYFRLRQKPARFETPIELQVGSGEQAIRVSLDRFQPLGRVDFALDFDEIGEAFNQYLDKTSPPACPEIEHLANGDFEQWLRVGEELSLPDTVALDANPAAIAIAPDGSRAYVASTRHSNVSATAVPDQGLLLVSDTACNQEIKDVMLTPHFPDVLAVNPAGSRAYVADSEENMLQVIDLDTQRELGQPLLLKGGANALALSPDGGRLYVTEYFYTIGNNEGFIRAIDAVKLEQAAIRGTPALEDVSIVAIGNPIPLGMQQRPTALAVAPDGLHLYVTVSNDAEAKGLVQIFDTVTFNEMATPKPLEVGQEPSTIALTPDGKWALVANAGSNSISIIDTARSVVVGSNIPLDGSPKALCISPESSRAYVAIVAANSGGASQDIILNVIDLPRRTVVNTMMLLQNIEFDTSLSVALALTPQGDKIYVSYEDESSIASIQIGNRLPVEWNPSGWVTPFCLPNPCHLIAVLGLPSQEGKQPMSSALSQVVPVVSACAYEFSFWGIATEPDAAVAEVIWISKDCGHLRVDKISIQALEQQKEAVMIKSNALIRAVNTASRPLLILHRVRLTTPVDAEQAEVHFNVPEGVVAGIDRVSLIATNETVANADLSLQQDNRIADWTLAPGVAPGVSLIAGAEGIQLRNAGAETAELVQTLSVKSNAPFALEFQGKAIMRLSTQVNPRIELRWLKADKSAAGSVTTLEILSTNLGSTLGNGTSPNDATQVEIHLVVSGGTTLEIKRISLRFSVPTLVPVTFVAQAPGELTVSDFKVAFEQAKVATPTIPAKGLCSSTSPGRQPGENPGDRCFCLCCETEQTMTEITPMETRSGRPALAGRCASCGGNLVRFGGQRVPDAQPFSLGRSGVSQPIVLRPIAPRVVTTMKEPLKTEMPVTISLTAIKGIGEASARRLAMIGIDSIEKLAAAVPEDVAKALETVSLKKAAEFIESAKQLLAPAKKS
jgi:YVTN family beta-propeller protein